MSPGQLLMELRSATFSGLYEVGCLRALAKPSSGSIRYCVLAYHGISDAPQPLFTSTRLFEAHLRFFRQWGSVASMDEVASFLSGQTVPAGPPLRFVITFDDGYANVIRNAVPLLRQHCARGIVYINPGWIDRGIIPWWFQLAGPGTVARQFRRKLAQEGFGGYQNLDEAEGDLWPMQLISAILDRVPQEQFEEWWSDRSSRGNEAHSSRTLNPLSPRETSGERAGERGTVAPTHIVPNVSANSFESPAPVAGSDSEAKLAGWTQLASARDVLDVGSHTYSHSILGLCRDHEFIRDQVMRSKAVIEQRLGGVCMHFAYPRGQETDHSQATQKLLAAARHRTAVTTRTGLVDAKTKCLEIPRFYIGETPVAELAAQLAGVLDLWDGLVNRLKVYR